MTFFDIIEFSHNGNGMGGHFLLKEVMKNHGMGFQFISWKIF